MADDNQPFKVGDTVRLKSGGTLMIVNGLGAGYVDCEWFDEERIRQIGSFNLLVVIADDGIPTHRVKKSPSIG
jgi:uncharacterized protein YodC (DUF2158 family)